MERVRVEELKAHYERVHGTRPTNAEIAEVVFKGDTTNDGRGAPLSDDRAVALIARWNNGHDLAALKPRHILRIGAFFGVHTTAEVLDQ